jgi:hypothetical protein
MDEVDCKVHVSVSLPHAGSLLCIKHVTENSRNSQNSRSIGVPNCESFMGTTCDATQQQLGLSLNHPSEAAQDGNGITYPRSLSYLGSIKS